MLESAGLQVLCYVVLLVMPVMGRMSDQNEQVRLMASRCFANLVTLMPLEVSPVCVNATTSTRYTVGVHSSVGRSSVYYFNTDSSVFVFGVSEV